MIIIKRLHIFIDESGDFGFVKGSSDLYAISFTLYESENSIENELEYLNNRLRKAEYDTTQCKNKDYVYSFRKGAQEEN